MKIDNAGKALANYSGPAKTALRDHVKTDGAEQESVAINPLASKIGAVERSLGAEPSFDAAKVDAIKQAIASGEFRVDAGAIADKLITSARELLGR
ncbi:flagellar biosynthesis anti-sigma factor FlgM [Crenobacter cavernae]|uniref:Negative regulator of flagellin synthesis n=1 Tax=Crenobacter cavernae TaxID=2290923 RepID=A0ABY0FDS6_9NEIS|nr:flagellar biosynthesis anti-sigma factor FlgM [Crenobacter cavernae]RXZ43342.1 flagellar biosynthesis anti-sigma factor FlgM [Crenobacter cavernae]